ncbi:fimbrial protein [Pantoea piersonii]|uniref:Fimbrial protein n=1 Tax=Pantoea piersonii TaxID=2364647 RepID=A0AAJ5QHA6_9GAMM|nr:fimbrial protein [Pantoea piersonii]WBG90507.1 fimbrial protein [Pantoea piersonii]
MNNKYFLALLIVLLNMCFITRGYAVNEGACQWSSGNTTKELDIPSDIISDATAGTVVTSTSKDYVGVNAICPNTSWYLSAGDGTTYRSYRTSLTAVSTEDSYQFLKVNDYLAIAVSIVDDYAARFYPPAEYVHMGWHGNVKSSGEFPVRDSNLIYKFKVLKAFTGTMTIPYTEIFSVYVGADIGSYNPPVMKSVVYRIVINGATISVPQTCTVNAGTTIDFDFSDINASSFSRAGAGVKPSDVSTLSKSFDIACSDSEASSTLKITLQTSTVSGNTIVSSNSDLGFIITDDQDNIIVPNDTTSAITTTLDSTSQATVTIKAYPVSVTGNTPEEGTFSATAYLLVEFA